MARAGVTYQDVAKAAIQINQQGKLPTVDAVREILGTGSKSTIGPLLKTWKEKQANNIDAQKAGLPPELITVVKNLYEGMQQQANEQIETAQSQAKIEVEEARRSLLELQNTYTDALSQLTKYKSIIEKSEQVNESLRTDFNEEQLAHTVLKNQHGALLQRLEDRNQEVLRQNSQLEQVQRNLDHYRDTAQKQREQERADFERQALNSEQSINQLKQEKQTLQQNLTGIELEYSKIEIEINQLRIANKTLTGQNQEKAEEVRQLQQQIVDIETRFNFTKQASEEAYSKGKVFEEQILKLEIQAAVDREKIQTLIETNKEVKGRVEQLRNENIILKQEKSNIEGQFQQLQRSLK